MLASLRSCDTRATLVGPRVLPLCNKIQMRRQGTPHSYVAKRRSVTFAVARRAGIFQTSLASRADLGFTAGKKDRVAYVQIRPSPTSFLLDLSQSSRAGVSNESLACRSWDTPPASHSLCPTYCTESALCVPHLSPLDCHVYCATGTKTVRKRYHASASRTCPFQSNSGLAREGSRLAKEVTVRRIPNGRFAILRALSSAY